MGILSRLVSKLFFLKHEQGVPEYRQSAPAPDFRQRFNMAGSNILSEDSFLQDKEFWEEKYGPLLNAWMKYRGDGPIAEGELENLDYCIPGIDENEAKRELYQALSVIDPRVKKIAKLEGPEWLDLVNYAKDVVSAACRARDGEGVEAEYDDDNVYSVRPGSWWDGKSRELASIACRQEERAIYNGQEKWRKEREKEIQLYNKWSDHGPG